MAYNRYYWEKNRKDLSMRIQAELSELGKLLGSLIKKEIYEDGLRTSKSC